MDFGKFMRESRIRKGYSQKKLADEVGMSQQLINAWENNSRRISLESADVVLKALGASMTIGGDADG